MARGPRTSREHFSTNSSNAEHSSTSRTPKGFYYDATKNRYFPLSSRPAQQREERNSGQDKVRQPQSRHENTSTTNRKVVEILHRREIGVTSRFSSLSATNYFKREFLETLASKPWVWSYGESCGIADGAIEEFNATIQTCEGLKTTDVIACGSNNGFLGLCAVMRDINATNGIPPRRIFPLSGVVKPIRRPQLVPTRVGPFSNSKVTTIRRLRNTVDVEYPSVILTTLGSALEGGAIYMLKQAHSDVEWNNSQLLPFDVTRSSMLDCSVWTSAYCSPTKATLGTSRGAVLVHFETSSLKWLIHSKSDVLSQQCDSTGNLIFCGFRNGYISMVDIRSPFSPKRMPAMNPERSSLPLSIEKKRVKYKGGSHIQRSISKASKIAESFSESTRMKSSICSLALLQSNEMHLLASAMNGDISLWDRRLVDKGPVLNYEGNNNTHSMLSLGVDNSESLLASGGEDCTLRIWSLRSGQLLETISGLPGVVTGFSSPHESGYGWQSHHAWRMWGGSTTGLMYIHDASPEMK